MSREAGEKKNVREAAGRILSLAVPVMAGLMALCAVTAAVLLFTDSPLVFDPAAAMTLGILELLAFVLYLVSGRFSVPKKHRIFLLVAVLLNALLIGLVFAAFALLVFQL